MNPNIMIGSFFNKPYDEPATWRQMHGHFAPGFNFFSFDCIIHRIPVGIYAIPANCSGVFTGCKKGEIDCAVKGLFSCHATNVPVVSISPRSYNLLSHPGLQISKSYPRLSERNQADP